MNQLSLALRRFQIFNGHSSRARAWLSVDGSIMVFGEDYVPDNMLEIHYIEPNFAGEIDYKIDMERMKK